MWIWFKYSNNIFRFDNNIDIIIIKERFEIFLLFNNINEIFKIIKNNIFKSKNKNGKIKILTDIFR